MTLILIQRKSLKFFWKTTKRNVCKLLPPILFASMTLLQNVHGYYLVD